MVEAKMNQTKNSKIALVTGASGGIGEALAECFARDGVALIITARSQDALERNASQWRQRYGVDVTVVACDLSEAGAAEHFAADILGRGVKLDYLVNNAGFGSYGLFAESDLGESMRMLRLNIEALTILTRSFLPGLVARRGKVLHVASTAAFQPCPYMAVYAATKAYVLSFSDAIAAELEGSGATVTALCPGPTTSGFQDKANMQDSAIFKGKRLPSAVDVAQAGYQAMMQGKPVFIHGAKNWFLALSIRFAPRRMVVSLVKKMSRPV